MDSPLTVIRAERGSTLTHNFTTGTGVDSLLAPISALIQDNRRVMITIKPPLDYVHKFRQDPVSPIIDCNSLVQDQKYTTIFSGGSTTSFRILRNYLRRTEKTGDLPR